MLRYSTRRGDAKITPLSNCVMYMTGAMAYQSGPYEASNSVLSVADFSQSVATTHTNNFICFNGTAIPALGGPNVGQGFTLVDSAICGKAISLVDRNAISVTLNNCDLGSAYGWNNSFSSSNMHSFNADFSTSGVIATNCLINSRFDPPNEAAKMLKQRDGLALNI